MPFWGWLYLLIFTVLSVAGIIEQLRIKQTAHAIATTISFIFFITFVIAFFQPELGATIGIFVIPMLIYVALYDWWLSNLDLQPKSPQFMQKLPDVETKMSDMAAMLILLPGYLAGLTLAYRAVMNG